MHGTPGAAGAAHPQLGLQLGVCPRPLVLLQLLFAPKLFVRHARHLYSTAKSRRKPDEQADNQQPATCSSPPRLSCAMRATGMVLAGTSG